MTYFDLSTYRRRASLPSPTCGTMPRRLFWKLAFSALCAVAAVYFRRRQS